MKEKNYSFLAFIKKTILLFLMMLFVNVGWGQVTIVDKLFLPSKNVPSGSTGWTISAVANNATPDYWKMLSGTNSMTSPVMNFSTYTGITVTLSLQSFGTILNNSDKIKLEYFDGTTWTQVGGLLTTGAKADQTVSLLSGSISSSAKIRITAPNATSAAGARVYSVEIKGTVVTVSAPTVTTTTATTITPKSALFAGNVTATGGSAITENGTVYAVTATNANPQIGGAGVTKLDAEIPGIGNFSDNSGEILSSNVQYSYNAYAINATGTGYGTVKDFWTLANIPAPPNVNNSTSNTLDVTININGNPSTTEYAIQNGSNYVQANGSLGATAVWQTKSTWGIKTVTGLTASTSYTFKVKARNGANTETSFGGGTSVSTMPDTAPSLIAGALLPFNSTCLNVTSDANNFTLIGNNLTGDVTVGALSGFAFSTTQNGTYTSTLTISPASQSINSTVNVKFTPTVVQSYNGNITISGGGISSVDVNAVASGVNTPVAVTTGTTYATSPNSASINGSLIQGCSGIVDYGVEYSTTINFDSGTGTPVASSNLNVGNFTVNLSGLESAKTYYYKAFATDDNGTVRGTQSSFMTDAIADPTATAATAVTQTGFTANWDAVSGATGYELDVYKSVGSITEVINETFTWSTNSTGGNDNLWSGVIASGTIAPEDLVGWALTSSTKANNCIKAGSGGNLGSVTTPALNFSGSGVLTFRAGAWNGGSEQTTLKLEISGGGTLNISQVTMVKGAFTDFSVNISDATALTKITFKGFANSNSRFFLDDVRIMSGTMVITPADGYPDLAVVGTSKAVTGLTPNTEYFYKVRAKDATSTSISSNEIAVKTKPTSVTWNGTAWSNTSGPDATIDAIIDGNFNQATDLTAKSLTINSGKVFTVKTGNTLTVVNAIINNAGVAGFVIESDAVVLQTSTAANTALATVKRNSTPLYRQDYTLWSSPVGGQNLRSFSPLTLFNRFYSYNTADNVYSQEIVTSQDSNDKTFNMGQGYLIRMPNIDDAQNPVVGYEGGTTAKMNMGSFKGTLTNGNVNFPLSLAGSKFNLVGNPYASPINISTFLTANASQIEGTLYFWRKTNSNTYPTGTGYVTYSLGGIVSIDPSLSGQTTLSSINTGQGFMVSAKSGAAAVAFSNTMRENASTLFFKSASENTNELHRFWLNLSNETNVVGQTLVAYATDATQDLDANFDAPYINDSPVALTSIINNTELIIQGRSLPFLNTDFVPLGFKTDVAGSYTIALSNFDGLFAESQDIFLKDKSTNTLHNLKTAAYAFTSPVGVFNDRFEVQYNSVLGTTNPTFDANTILIAVKNQQININAGSVTMEKIELIDVSGRVLFTVKDVNATTATIQNLKASNQMLIVRISTKENGLVSKKIIF